MIEMSTEFHNKLDSWFLSTLAHYVITGKLKGQGRIDF